jgi:hypothetical protein
MVRIHVGQPILLKRQESFRRPHIFRLQPMNLMRTAQYGATQKSIPVILFTRQESL